MSDTATDTLYRALRSANADPDLAHAAAEAVRDMSGQNVVTAIRADIAELRSELRSELHSEIAELRSEFRSEIAELRSELRAEIAELRGMMITANRLNTALVIILGTGVVAMLVQVLGIAP